MDEGTNAIELDAAARAVELFFEVGRLNRRYAESRYGSLNPLAGQKHCLLVLRAAGETSQKHLAELLGIRSTSAGELLGKLEAKGLVTRRPSPQDGRVTLAALTGAGRAEADKIERARANAHRELVSALTADETAELSRLLAKICAGYRELLGEVR